MDTKAINVFLDKLTKDQHLRAEFAKDPHAVLTRENVALPEGMIGKRLDPSILNERLDAVAHTIESFKRGGLQLDPISVLIGRVASTVIGTVV
jgi:hypothetical protein